MNRTPKQSKARGAITALKVLVPRAAVMARFEACWLGRVLWCTPRLGFGLVEVANWWCVSFAATRLGLLDLPIGASSRTRLESDQHQTTNDIDRESGGRAYLSQQFIQRGKDIQLPLLPYQSDFPSQVNEGRHLAQDGCIG